MGGVTRLLVIVAARRARSLSTARPPLDKHSTERNRSSGAHPVELHARSARATPGAGARLATSPPPRGGDMLAWAHLAPSRWGRVRLACLHRPHALPAVPRRWRYSRYPLHHRSIRARGRRHDEVQHAPLRRDRHVRHLLALSLEGLQARLLVEPRGHFQAAQLERQGATIGSARQVQGVIQAVVVAIWVAWSNTSESR